VARGSDATLVIPPPDDRVLQTVRADRSARGGHGLRVAPDDLRADAHRLRADDSVPDACERLVRLARATGRRHEYTAPRARRAPWRVVAVIRRDSAGAEWRAEFADFEAAGRPRIRLDQQHARALRLAPGLSQLDTALCELGDEAFRLQIRPRRGRSRSTNFVTPDRSGAPRSEMAVPTVRVKSFAKINLTLRVLGTRADGYHELRTTFQSLALHDTLTCTERRGPFEITCSSPDCPVDATNLVWKAADAVCGAP
jgi:hypothetical protein